MKANLKVEGEHGVVCAMPRDASGYFGWPTVGRMDDGSLVVASSGLRTQHVCPWGKTVLFTSGDDGDTWSEPFVLNDCPIDDRDAGVICLGGRKRLVSWFTSDTRQHYEGCRTWLGEDVVKSWDEKLATWTDELVQQWLGSWVRTSEDGESWSDPIKVPVSAPHGPIRLASGTLLYLGKVFGVKSPDGTRTYTLQNLSAAGIQAMKSGDDGRTWTDLGVVPLAEGTEKGNYHEPHVVELASGKLVGHVRFQNGEGAFTIYQTESEDGGATWTRAAALDVYGSPPHLLRHSSGALVCVYGYRKPPFGERAMISRDDGATWDTDFILRDDGPDGDLGYPSSVELADGRLFTLYYQKINAGDKCSLLWTRWRLPEA